MILAITIPAVLVSSLSVAAGQSAWYEGFEQIGPSWRFLGSDGRYAIRDHQRTPHIRRTGERSEKISITGEGGTYVYVGHDVGSPRVIEELVPTVQIRADRAGIQMLAEITLPRTSHPETGEPLTALVRGTTYSEVGKWQQLRIDDLPRLLTRQAQILRNEFGPGVDPREAYISKIVLNVYGGPGATSVWIDDLDISGYVETSSSSSESPASSAQRSSEKAVSSRWQGASYPAGREDAERRVRLDRSLLLVDERPFFVRAVRWRGEPLTALKVLGFNTVWLTQPPSPELLAEADRSGMWLISPPPSIPSGPTANARSTSSPVFGSEYRSVLAWDLGGGLGQKETDSVRRWAERLRSADSRFRRPLIARPESSLRAYSRIADILVIGRPALGSSLELADYAKWLRLRPRLARPGTPVWVVVPTGPEPPLLAQWEAISSRGPSATGFSSEQLRLITYVSCASGARGLLFESHSPMDSTGPAAEVRRTTLELLNLELTLAEPWLAGGSFVAMADATDPDILAAVFQTKRSRLVLPIWAGRGAVQVPGLSSERTISVVVPGVPEADEAHQMIPGRLRRARSKRVTGGTRITVDNFALTSQLLVTQVPLDHNNRSRQAGRIGPRAAELQRRLVELEKERFERLVVPLTVRAPETRRLESLESDVPTLRRASQEALQRCETALTKRNYAEAYTSAEEAMRPFRLLEREHWLAAAESVSGPASSPFLATFATLNDHWTFFGEVSQAAPGGNLLAGGDFENLKTWRTAGWDHYQHPVPAVEARANLSPEAARSGNLGLRLAVAPTDPDQVPQLVESPPVWIASAPVQLPSRSVIAIRGWVRIPAAIRGGPDGLLVFDSFTGRALAERLHANEQWEEFVLYRVCPQSGPLRITFALSGVGTAYVDDVTVHRLTDGMIGPSKSSVQAQFTPESSRRSDY